jgi:murein DD-endopeptidase MepM/ murein hydrolase activator NlpD
VEGRPKAKIFNFGLQLLTFNFALLISLGPLLANTATEDVKSVEELQKQIVARSQEIRRLEEEARRYRMLVGQKAQEQKSLTSQVNLLEAEIKELTLRIRITQTHIQRTEATVEELSLDISEKERQIGQTKEYLAALIQELNEKDSETLLTTLLRAPSLAVFSEELEYTLNLNQSVHERLTTLKLLTNQLEDEKKAAEEKKEDLEASHKELSVRENVTEDKKEERERLLTLTGKAKKGYEQTLKEIEQQQKAIQEEIIAFEAKLRQLLDPKRLPGSQPGLLAWPVRGTMSQGYGPTSETGFLNHAYKFHNGIDVAVPSGTPIKAAHDGVVKAVGDNGKYAYGRWVAIEHGNGLTTLYAHFSSAAVSPGQKIGRGEVLGYSGSTGFSTGPHLHFTVYATQTFKTEQRWFGLLPLGGSVNPLLYL